MIASEGMAGTATMALATDMRARSPYAQYASGKRGEAVAVEQQATDTSSVLTRAPEKETADNKSAQEMREQVEQAVEKANANFHMDKRSIRFRIHDETNTVQIQVVDMDKDTVIRTIPSEEMIRLSQSMREYCGVGQVMDESL